jgi:ubiquinone/menaquinone biosynthesis C-methylase UbiE
MKDNFSSHASTYAQFRPVYPAGLYDFVLRLVSETKLAWDCGCGNGQVAGVLADYFETVEATDISEKQIEFAVRKPNIHYRVAPAEKTNLADESVNLITIAQAIHWFDFEAFYREVHRVSKPGGILAVWCYSLLEINESIDQIIRNFYSDTLGEEYWDAERHFVDEHYQTIPFPFEEIKAPEFSIRVNWGLEHLIGYLNSWSAVQHYIRKNGENPVDLIEDVLKKAWGEQEILSIKFPLFTRIGKSKE